MILSWHSTGCYVHSSSLTIAISLIIWCMAYAAMTGERVRRLRQKLGLTQERLAQLLGVSWTTVNRWEAGASAPIGMAAKLLNLLEQATHNHDFLSALSDPRSSDPLFVVHQLLSGVYG